MRLLHTAGPGRPPLRLPAMASPSPGTGPGPPERARRPAPSLSLRARRRAAANHQACRGAGGSGGSRRAAGAAMEDVCAKFVSQKISKTRWRPLPAAALQPPDLFATGSWDNEVAGGRVRRRGASFPPGRGTGGGTPCPLGPLSFRRLPWGSAARGYRERLPPRRSLGCALVASLRNRGGLAPLLDRVIPPGERFPPAGRGVPQERCAACSLLLSLAIARRL